MDAASERSLSRLSWSYRACFGSTWFIHKSLESDFNYANDYLLHRALVCDKVTPGTH